MEEQICQSRLLDQFEHGGRFALRRKVYRENEERVEIFMCERSNGILDTLQFLDAMDHRIGRKKYLSVTKNKESTYKVHS